MIINKRTNLAALVFFSLPLVLCPQIRYFIHRYLECYYTNKYVHLKSPTHTLAYLSYVVIWEDGFYSLQKNKIPETIPIMIC